MTCQHCQTWIGDQEHRCPRCSRRVRTAPSRISASTYPIAAAATALAYEQFEEEAPARSLQPEPAITPDVQPRSGQQALFDKPVNEPRVISFDSLTTPAQREAIRVRAREVNRPAPLKSERVELKRPRSAKADLHARDGHQRSLEFIGQNEAAAAPGTSIICNAPVAPAGLRARAGMIDGLVMVLGCAVTVGIFAIGGALGGGGVVLDKHTLPYLVMALMTIPLSYKLLWTLSGQDSLGMQKLGLTLVDFDGNPPSKEHRYQRFFGSLLSVLAAGMGLVWTFVDEDTLAWHDHISGTFPTVIDED